ncbi:DUF6054 family protein [Clostridium estertheticum]|nr:DUF6054 family protein [Clostridium estertheticum]WAG63423.1 DUF6054 family protein [Clostridium estertheticum]
MIASYWQFTVGAGGGKGIIFNFSLGAEDDMVAVVERGVEGMV